MSASATSTSVAQSDRSKSWGSKADAVGRDKEATTTGDAALGQE